MEEQMVQPSSPKKSLTKSPKRLPPPPLAARVKVAVRVRPPETCDGDEPPPLCITNEDSGSEVNASGNLIHFQVESTEKSFRFDHVFSSEASQADVYNTALQPLLASLIHGFNVTVLAYGQTGSGKTYTMGGSETRSSNDDGLILRLLRDLFDVLKNEASLKTTAKVSFLEIYCDEIRDLLVDGGERPRSLSQNSYRTSRLTIHEDDCDVRVEGLQEIKVQSVVEALTLLRTGRQRQTTGAHALNDQSSRSHAIYTLEIARAFANEIKRAKVTFVDLAGSERVKKTLMEGQGMKEGSHINIGLLALGNVINALGSRHRRLQRRNTTGISGERNNVTGSDDMGSLGRAHVPYRSSKLTRLLRDALGGNSVTLFIACISPEITNCNETLCTLQYANRARSIQNKAQKNVEDAVTEDVVDDVSIVQATENQREINALREQVAALKMQLERAVAVIKTVEVRDSKLSEKLPEPTGNTVTHKNLKGRRQRRIASLELDIPEPKARLESEQCGGVVKKNIGNFKDHGFSVFSNTASRTNQPTTEGQAPFVPELPLNARRNFNAKAIRPIKNEAGKLPFTTIQTSSSTSVREMINRSTQYEPSSPQHQRKTPVDYVLLPPSQIFREVHSEKQKALGAPSPWPHRRRLDVQIHESRCFSATLASISNSSYPNNTSDFKSPDVLRNLLQRTQLFMDSNSNPENKVELENQEEDQDPLTFEDFVAKMTALYDQRRRLHQFVHRLTQRFRHLANVLDVPDVDSHLIKLNKFTLEHQQSTLQERLEAFERLAADRLWTRLQHREAAAENYAGIWNGKLTEVFMTEDQYEACTSWHTRRTDREFFQQHILPFILNGWISVTPSDLEAEQLWLTL
ncbi:hypothetical protein DVH05_019872 [Phytophthora capsici]|nr:hypothetical protein DVH05_019872 [Phytophthora capsici]